MLEYLTSIGLSLVAGLLGGEFMPAFREKGLPPHRVILPLPRVFAARVEANFAIEAAARQFDKLVKAVTYAATGTASIYPGIKAFLGGRWTTAVALRTA